jgi:hypothetical protein
MQTQRIVLSLAIAIGTLSPALSEEYRGTWEQQMACTPDVMRLCSDQIPDVSRIVACLRQNTPSLGSSCRAVFESNASADQPPTRVPPPTTAQRPRAAQPAPPVQPRPSYNNDE